MSHLAESVDAVTTLLRRAELGADGPARELLSLTHERRRLDLSDLTPAEQAGLIAERCEQLQPSEEALAQRIAVTGRAGRRFVAKFGIDPTGHEVHLGHAVPIMLLDRFQRMGHEVVFIVGDVTAKIGDPSGRSDERPPLTDEEIATNLATYRQQVSPFFDFDRARFAYNGDWLRQVTLPRLIEITSQVPVSMSLQREDFRKRLDAGHGLSLAELLYSVVMALDSVETRCDLEVGGIDQFLNMQMCRKVMEICGIEPELVVANALIEGTDGTGAKMSKSRGNYVPLTAPPDEVFGKLMSVPDRLVRPYLAALSEWRDSELDVLEDRIVDRSLHPVDAKRILAGEVTAALHDVEAAMRARAAFRDQFAQPTYARLDLPVVEASWGAKTVAEVVRELGFAPSNREVRRLAEQGGLRLVREPAAGAGAGENAAGGVAAVQEQFELAAEEVFAPFADALGSRRGGRETGEWYLKIGRKLARVEPGEASAG
jgi:tyrosyl-tRNA synthetase